jgi:hypothetical protein
VSARSESDVAAYQRAEYGTWMDRLPRALRMSPPTRFPKVLHVWSRPFRHLILFSFFLLADDEVKNSLFLGAGSCKWVKGIVARFPLIQLIQCSLVGDAC